MKTATKAGSKIGVTHNSIHRAGNERRKVLIVEKYIKPYEHLGEDKQGE